MLRSNVVNTKFLIYSDKENEMDVVSLNLSRKRKRTKSRNPWNPWAIAPTSLIRLPIPSRTNIHRLGRRFHQRTRITEPHNCPPLRNFQRRFSRRGGDFSFDGKGRMHRRGVHLAPLVTFSGKFIHWGGQPSSPSLEWMRAILIFWKTRQVSRHPEHLAERNRREPIKYLIADVSRNSNAPRIICIPPPFFSSSN